MPKQFGYSGRTEGNGGDGGSGGGGKKGGKNHDACYDQPGEAYPGNQPAMTSILSPEKLGTDKAGDKSTGPSGGGGPVPSQGQKNDD